MPQSNELRVFISSTFRDLGEEREHLVKKIFPEIRALCRQRGITFTEVDLRWGLTEEDAMLGQIIRTCLEEVDKCRPYFIGMLGNRYGWVPEFHEILMDPDLLAKYPWIEEAAMDGMSVTEMEFVHGVFNAPENSGGERTFFYHRDDDKTDADNPERLQGLIERVKSTEHPFRDFSTIDELGQLVRNDLLDMIDRYWPETEAPSPLELERRAHSAFAISRTRAYIPNPHYLKEFAEWVSKGDKPLIVSGDSGLGKSSLVAYAAGYYRTKNPKALMIEHYVGASNGSGSSVAIMRHVIQELSAHFSVDEEIPTSPQALQQSFQNWLHRAERLTSESDIPVLIVIDALDQLSSSGKRLAWLPESIPPTLKLLVSTTPGETLDHLNEREWSALHVKPLDDERVRQSIVVRYLGEFRKGISPEHIRRIITDAKGTSPLFLRVVAEELRLHGGHETLGSVIDTYTSANDLLEVFNRLLERLESDFGEALIGNATRAIALSRNGLTEQALLGITGMSRLDLSRLVFAFDYHLIRRDGLLGFFHNYLRQAVERRYLSDEAQQQETRGSLIDYFAAQPPEPWVSRELVWQLSLANQPERLAETLSTIPHYMALVKGGGEFEALSHWTALSEQENMVEWIDRGIERWREEDRPPMQEVEGLKFITQLLSSKNHWNRALEIAEHCVTISRDADEKFMQAVLYRQMVPLHYFLGNQEEAFQKSSQALELFEQLEDSNGIASIAGYQTALYTLSGAYELAIECGASYLQHHEERHDLQTLMAIYGNLGIAHQRCGNAATALEFFQQAAEVSEELGDLRHVAHTLGNMGSLLTEMEEYAQAVECLEKDLALCEQFGDRSNITVACVMMTSAYVGLGDADRAFASARRGLTIAEELGNHGYIIQALSCLGSVHNLAGEYQEAIDCYRRGIQLCSEIGDRHNLASLRGGMGTALMKIGELDTALENFTEAVSLLVEIGDRFRLQQYCTERAEAFYAIWENCLEPPAYLKQHLPEATGLEWSTTVLKRAREEAERGRELCRDLNLSRSLIASRALLARIDIAEGNTQQGVSEFQALLSEIEMSDNNPWASNQLADIHFELWKLDRSDNLHATRALGPLPELVPADST
ncbi:MAG: tetratricopeptide repeat protein [Candidatus Kapaibacterium sp.]